jgi:hypothetical protein
MPATQSANSRDRFLLLALFCALVAALPLLIGPGIVNTRAGGDSPFLLLRVHQLAANLRAGTLPARWMPDAALGLGYPAFNFYAALPYYLAALLSELGLGIVWGIKLTQLAGFLLAAGGTYQLARALGARRPGALLAAIAYTAAPFHLVNVYVRGDALSEFWAMALLPTALWALSRLMARPSAGRAAAMAGAYAALVLSHNISALIASPLLGLWLLAELPHLPRDRRWPALLWGSGALGLGLLLSAWFWAPALRETSLVQLGEQTTGYFNFGGHFRAANLVQGHLVHDYRIDGTHDPFSMGLVQTALLVLGLAALVLRAVRRQPLTWREGVLGAGLLVSTWLITPWSRWAWEHLPLLAYAQFPWRLLGLQALLEALLLPQGEHLLPSHHTGAAVTLTLSGLALAAGMLGLRIDRLPVRQADITPQALMVYEAFSGNIGGTVRAEYLPREMVPRPYTSGVMLNGGVKPAPLALEGELAAASLLERTPERERWSLKVGERALLAFHTTYFPGWEAQVDGQPQGVEPLAGLGLIGLRLDAGTHDVALHFEATPTRRYATWASLAGLAVWLGMIGWPALAERCYRRRLIAGIGLLALSLSLTRLAQPACERAPGSAPAATQAPPRIMDWARAPYPHQELVQFDGAQLLATELSQDDLLPGSSLVVRLTWDVGAPAHTARLELRALSAHLFAPAPVWAVAEAPLESATQALNLPLPLDLPPGYYALYLDLLRDGAALPPTTAKGVTMDGLVIATLPSHHQRLARGDEPILAAYGPPERLPVIALLGAQAQRQGDSLVVTLDWRSERQAPLNYYLSLRLVHSDGSTVVSRDLAPFAGNYPTSLWRPGELLSDRVLLPLEQNISLEGAILEVVLYDRLTLAGVGAGSVPLER